MTETEELWMNIDNLIKGQAQLNNALRNLGQICLDLNNRMGAIETALVVLNNKQTLNPTGYKPFQDKIIQRMETTGDSWEKCEADLIREHHEHS